MNDIATGRTLNATIFTLALTDFLQAGMTAFAAAPLMGELGMGPEQFSFVAAVYASVAIFAISMHRWCVERLGGRRYVQLCAGVLITGSVMCALSDDFGTFLAGRSVMALGAGIFTSSRMIIHHTLAGPRRFKGIQSLASGLAIGIAAAPWVAAQAVASDVWSAMYWTVAALGVLVLVLAELALPAAPLDRSASRSQVQPWPQLLLAAASFLLLLALQRSNYDFFDNKGWIGLAVLAGLGGLVAYLWHQRYHTRPLLRVSDMLHSRYLFGLAVFFFAYLMLGANNYMVPVMLQRTLGFAWETVGHVEALGLGFALLTWLAMSQWLPRHPAPRKFLAVGFLALAAFGALLSRIDSGADLWLHVLPALALNSIFLLTVLPVTAMQTFREMEKDERLFSNAQQLKNMMGQAGIAIGIAAATLGQQWRTALHYSTLSESLNPYNPVFRATLDGLQRVLGAGASFADTTRMALARVAQMTEQQAALLSNIDHFRAIAVLGVLGIAVTVSQKVFR
ncbi:MAG: MFS transporter [Burkholderiales bacterium]